MWENQKIIARRPCLILSLIVYGTKIIIFATAPGESLIYVRNYYFLIRAEIKMISLDCRENDIFIGIVMKF